MCPEKKVDWFDKNSDWCPEDRLEVRKIVHKRWAESYGASLSTETMATSWDGWSAKGEPTCLGTDLMKHAIQDDD